MTGISGSTGQFIQEYNRLKKDGNLSSDDIKKLSELAKNSNIDLNVLKSEIFKDSIIDDNEKKLLLTIGFSSDQENLSSEIKKHETDPKSTAISNLLEAGMKEKKSANVLIRIGEEIDNDSTMNPYEKPEKKAEISVKEQVENRVFNEISSLDNKFSKSASETDCIEKALRVVEGNQTLDFDGNKKFDYTKIKEGKLSEEMLKNATGRNWDSIDVSSYKNNPEALISLMLSAEVGVNGAMISVGQHVYMFQYIDKDNNIVAYDPSDRELRSVTINPKNQNATIFVMGEGDKNKTEQKAPDASSIIKFSKISSLKGINSSDKNDKTGESWEIRKLMTLMADPSEKETFNKIVKLIQGGNNSIKELQSLLESKGIKIDSQELRAMVKRMTEEIKLPDGSKTSMLEQFKNLQTSSAETKNNFLIGVQYSDVNLTDYFTSTNSKSMYDVFQKMIQGREGC